MIKNPRRPSTEEFAQANKRLQADLLAFADWFSSVYHDEEAGNADDDLEDSIIQTLALANMAMVETLSIHYGRRINVASLLEPVIKKTIDHDELQKNCPHKGNGQHDCRDHS